MRQTIIIICYNADTDTELFTTEYKCIHAGVIASLFQILNECYQS